MQNPDVTVVIGAYNSMPYVTTAVTSVLEQSIGVDRLELIAVDDGSTDETGEELDRLAANCPRIRVVHQQNSGGPAGPRNVGIELARGRYVFFLDADDYLGTEALDRMVAIADRNNSDVVLGRMVGVNGRGPPRSMFHRSWERADLFTSRVWWTLSAQKLFRKALIDRLSLRFPNLKIAQDQPFAGMAYLHANAISVVADYDCYYIVRRNDGANNTKRQRDPLDRLTSVETMMRMVADHVEPGENRDTLMERHFQYDLAKGCLSGRFLDADTAVREQVTTRCSALVSAYWTPWLARRAPIGVRLRCELVRRGQVANLADLIRFDRAGDAGKRLVEKGKVYAAYPFLGDVSVGISDDCYDVTDKLKVRHRLDGAEWRNGLLHLRGHAYIDHVDTTAPATTVILRERGSGAEYPVQTDHTRTPHLTQAHGGDRYTYGLSGFVAVIDPAVAAAGTPLPDGLWDVFLSVCHQGVVKEIRLGRNRGESVPARPATRVVRTGMGDPLVVTLYLTPAGDLTLDIGQIKHSLVRNLRVDRVAWSDRGGSPAFLLSGHGGGSQVAVVLEGGAGVTHRVHAQVDSNGSFSAVVRLGSAASGRPLGSGRWRVSVETITNGISAIASTPLSKPTGYRVWWRRGVPALAVIRGQRHGALTLTVPSLASRESLRMVATVVRRRLFRQGR